MRYKELLEELLALSQDKLEEDVTLYSVSSGSYSDYGVSCLFTTEESAQKYIDIQEGRDYDEFRVEEFSLNPVSIDWLNRGYNYYDVSIYKPYIQTTVWLVNEEVVKDAKEEESEDTHYYRYRVKAQNKEHAAKIATERRSVQILKDELDASQRIA